MGATPNERWRSANNYNDPSRSIRRAIKHVSICFFWHPISSHGTLLNKERARERKTQGDSLLIHPNLINEYRKCFSNSVWISTSTEHRRWCFKFFVCEMNVQSNTGLHWCLLCGQEKSINDIIQFLGVKYRFNLMEKENNVCVCTRRVVLAVVSVNFRKGGGISNQMELT